MRAWYGGAPVEEVTGLAWPALDAAFHDYLEGLPMPPEVESFARAKFNRPGIFGRRCPHVVDAIRHEADVCRDTQRFDEAIRLYESALKKDPLDFASKQSHAVTMRRHVDRENGRAELEGMVASESVPRTYRDRADEALADADFIDGKVEAAGRRYAALAERSIDEDGARTLEVKLLATVDPRRSTPSSRCSSATKSTARTSSSPGSRSAVGATLPSPTTSQAATSSSTASSRKGPPRSTKRSPATSQPNALREKRCANARSPRARAMFKATLEKEVRAAIESPTRPFVGVVGSGRRDATLRMIARCALDGR